MKHTEEESENRIMEPALALHLGMICLMLVLVSAVWRA